MRTAKFFCEFCDYEVPIDARFCPRCGHFFASVRCPVCGKTGDQNLFRHGCPQCGYGSSPSSKTSADKKNDVKKERHKLNLPKFSTDVNLTEGEKRNIPIGTLPIWVYIVVLFLVLGILLLAEAVL